MAQSTLENSSSLGEGGVSSANELQRMNDLSRARNRERAGNQSSPLPQNLSQRGGGDSDTQAQNQSQRRQPRKARPIRRVQSTSSADRARALGEEKAKAKKNRSGQGSGYVKQSEYERYMQNPIGTATYLGFLMIGVVQDGLPLTLDLVFGIGWVFGYMILPFTWLMYLYLIVRRVPLSMKRKFIFRSALLTSVTFIPYLGELLPEWIATAVATFIVMKRYESGAGGLENVSSSASAATGGGASSGGKKAASAAN